MADQDLLTLKRRESTLGRALEREKLERARAMSPEERVQIALELSNVCLELRRSWSSTP
ncbi:hypothetical protein [Candidatus Nitrospira bockiana]